MLTSLFRTKTAEQMRRDLLARMEREHVEAGANLDHAMARVQMTSSMVERLRRELGVTE